MVVHPQRPCTAYVIPLNGDDRGRYVPDGSMAVWRTQDDGATLGARSTRACRSTTPTWASCARRWPPTRATRPSIYFGTSTGQLFGSRGRRRVVAADRVDILPGISSVETAVLD